MRALVAIAAAALLSGLVPDSVAVAQRTRGSVRPRTAKPNRRAPLLRDTHPEASYGGWVPRFKPTVRTKPGDRAPQAPAHVYDMLRWSYFTGKKYFLIQHAGPPDSVPNEIGDLAQHEHYLLGDFAEVDITAPPSARAEAWVAPSRGRVYVKVTQDRRRTVVDRLLGRPKTEIAWYKFVNPLTKSMMATPDR